MIERGVKRIKVVPTGNFLLSVGNRLARCVSLSGMCLRNASLKIGCYAFGLGCSQIGMAEGLALAHLPKDVRLIEVSVFVPGNHVQPIVEALRKKDSAKGIF
jgi:hypothetical protein